MNCEVDMYDFSAHAGHSELAEFVRACDPENVVLFHSEDRAALAEDLGDEFRLSYNRHLKSYSQGIQREERRGRGYDIRAGKGRGKAPALRWIITTMKTSPGE